MASEPNVVFLDVETSPLKGWSWQAFDTNLISIIEPVKLLCFAWKRLGEKEVHVLAQCDYPDYVPGVVDDSDLAHDLWKVLDEADVVIAHNGIAFDCKVANARFVANNLKAPSDYKTIDTLKVAKKHFKFSTNSLNDLGIYLGKGKKAETGGFGTWIGCMNGDPLSWKRMKSYNCRDITLLEDVYLQLRPFMDSHPNLNLIHAPKIKRDEFPCDVCQSTDTTKRGFSMTKVGRYQRYSCNSCGSWSQGPYQRVYKDERALTEG